MSSEFKLKTDFARKKPQKFFNDKEPQEYYGFLILNPEIIPTECLYKKEEVCWLWIREDLVRKFNLNFEKFREYQFILTLQNKGAAKFIIGKSNKMVLNSTIYFKNTIKKIGVCGSENYFYEQEENKQDTNNSPPNENKNSWGKIMLLSLPIILLVLFFFLIIKQISKRKL